MAQVETSEIQTHDVNAIIHKHYCYTYILYFYYNVAGTMFEAHCCCCVGAIVVERIMRIVCHIIIGIKLY